MNHYGDDEKQALILSGSGGHRRNDSFDQVFEDPELIAALEPDQTEINHYGDEIEQPKSNTQDRVLSSLPPGVPPLTRSLDCSSAPNQQIRHFRHQSEKINENIINNNKEKQFCQVSYNVVQVLTGDGSAHFGPLTQGPAISNQRLLTAPNLKQLLENKFANFSQVAEQQICPENYNIHMLYRYITELYPSLHPQALQSCGSGLKMSFLLGIQPIKIQKNKLIIDVQDQNVKNLIDKLQRMFLCVLECVDFPSFFGVAFVTKNTYQNDQTCHLKLQYCNGNIDTIYSTNYKQLKNEKFNLIMICDQCDKWPLITCYSLAGLNPEQNGLNNFLFPDYEQEKKIRLEILSRQNFCLQDLSEKQIAAVSAILGGVSAPFPFVVLGQCDYEIGDVVMESVVQQFNNDGSDNCCLVIFDEFDQNIEELLDDIRDVVTSQHQFEHNTVYTLQQFENVENVNQPMVLFLDKFQATEYCWNDKRPHFSRVFFMQADEIEEAFMFTILAGIQNFAQEQQQKNPNIIFCGKENFMNDGILQRLLQSKIYNFNIKKEEDIFYQIQQQNQNGVLQLRPDLFKQEEFPGWMCDLWQEYIDENSGNPNYICRL